MYHPYHSIKSVYTILYHIPLYQIMCVFIIRYCSIILLQIYCICFTKAKQVITFCSDIKDIVVNPFKHFLHPTSWNIVHRFFTVVVKHNHTTIYLQMCDFSSTYDLQYIILAAKCFYDVSGNKYCRRLAYYWIKSLDVNCRFHWLMEFVWCYVLLAYCCSNNHARLMTQFKLCCTV
jgi:hypothetical protein